MKHFTRDIRIDNKWVDLEMTQYKSRNMYISNTYKNFRIVISYNTIIGFINEVNNTFITWGYSEYSCTTSKQITQLCYEQNLKLEKVAKYTYNFIDMLEHYLIIYDLIY